MKKEQLKKIQTKERSSQQLYENNEMSTSFRFSNDAQKSELFKTKLQHLILFIKVTAMEHF